MSGISCWIQNKDKIYNNNFIENFREGIIVLGSSTSEIKHNIFYKNPAAVVCAKINSKKIIEQEYGNPEIVNNIFWLNEKNAVKDMENKLNINY